MYKIGILWLVILGVVIWMSLHFQKEKTTFLGIADTREIIINNEYPVLIKKIYVLSGQAVDTGDSLVAFIRPELDRKIAEVSHAVARIKAQKTTDYDYVKSQINQLKAQRAAKENESRALVEELKNKARINKELTSELKSVSVKKDETQAIPGSIQLKIDNLEKELELVINEIDLKIRQFQNMNTTPVAVQLENLEDELKVLNEEAKKLTVISSIKGLIGSVNFKEGENASPFASIITLHTKSPSYVIGYIPENVYNKACEGQTVSVSSLTNRGLTDGIVIGIGSRIVSCPARLWKRPDLQVWGREVQIKIPESNQFLLGEKVSIQLHGECSK
jgi:HlyD family secretion protein